MADGYGMGKHKGGGLAVMIGIGKGPKGMDKGDEPKPDDTEAEPMDGCEAACDEAFDALKADDREGFREAFMSAVEMVARRVASESSESEEGEE